MESLKTEDPQSCECTKFILSVQDAMYAVSGKWKLPILVALRQGNKRFKEISNQLNGITDKVLSKELKELELNLLVKRTIHDTLPQRIEYEITDHGLSLEDVLASLKNWGDRHRKKIFDM
jgi:DNA-binding HxlR family transcriptional regulator